MRDASANSATTSARKVPRPRIIGVEPAVADATAPRKSAFIACNAGAQPKSTAETLQAPRVKITIRTSSVNSAHRGASVGSDWIRNSARAVLDVELEHRQKLDRRD